MAAPSAPLPPAIEAAHRVLADNEPMSAAELSDRLRIDGFRLPIDRIAPLPDRFPDRFHMTAEGHLSIGTSEREPVDVTHLDDSEDANWYRPGHQTVAIDRVAILDIETTGLDSAKDHIWELALVRLDGQPLADIGVELTAGIPRPTDDGRTPVALGDAIETQAAALSDIDLFVGHNLLAFDVPFLTKAAQRVGIDPPMLPPCADSIHLSILVDATIPNRSLADLLQRQELTRGETHRALADASATAEVVRGLLAEVDMSEPSWPLAIAEMLTPREPALRPTELPDAHRRALLERTQRSFTTMARSGFEVCETWTGHGTAVHSYEAFDGRPVSGGDDATREFGSGALRVTDAPTIEKPGMLIRYPAHQHLTLTPPTPPDTPAASSRTTAGTTG